MVKLPPSVQKPSWSRSTLSACLLSLCYFLKLQDKDMWAIQSCHASNAKLTPCLQLACLGYIVTIMLAASPLSSSEQSSHSKACGLLCSRYAATTLRSESLRHHHYYGKLPRPYFFPEIKSILDQTVCCVQYNKEPSAFLRCIGRLHRWCKGHL